MKKIVLLVALLLYGFMDIQAQEREQSLTLDINYPYRLHEFNGEDVEFFNILRNASFAYKYDFNQFAIETRLGAGRVFYQEYFEQWSAEYESTEFYYANLSVNFHWNFLKQNKLRMSAFAGPSFIAQYEEYLTKELRNPDIAPDPSSLYWLSYEEASGLNLGLSAGINTDYLISPRFFVNQSFRYFYYPTAFFKQKHSLFVGIGFGYRFVKFLE